MKVVQHEEDNAAHLLADALPDDDYELDPAQLAAAAGEIFADETATRHNFKEPEVDTSGLDAACDECEEQAQVEFTACAGTLTNILSGGPGLM